MESEKSLNLQCSYLSEVIQQFDISDKTVEYQRLYLRQIQSFDKSFLKLTVLDLLKASVRADEQFNKLLDQRRNRHEAAKRADHVASKSLVGAG